ncbi:ShlB/FhaC/HecB family hemolysin secretion/activation protein [Sphingomonas sp. KR1UV-12]|uniref:ShlB/FhaC/HecB family hemolysin secretion/activation protein n=1 Tax=Sphingomonas aurea TaxID=3063994 RepID=A0ABT9EHN6_9SPHN|nr:ShlB/FhaC/HecB family hemolysin secretion/activation protein [Sphingomonas sp. KR1UV-12]MDP1026490.1 ShlB/FhaC/HecB family hemolysin secretion/activation protein [Sphingomonas sp. KR1UV-12]
MPSLHDRSASLRRALSLLAGSASLFAAASAAAQSVPNAGSLLNEQRSTATTPRPVPEAAPVIAVPETRTAVPAGEVSVTIRAITFSGDTALADSEALVERTREAIGRTLDHPGLQALADGVTRYLRARGYALAYAYLPRQDVTEGSVTIAIVGGRLAGADAVTVVGRTRIDQHRLTAPIVRATRRDAPLRTAELERAMLLVNDLPGITARATLEPGSRTGTSRLVLQAEEAPLIGSELSIDNYGSPSTGMLRTGAGLRLNDPLRIGDEAALGARFTSGSTLVNGLYALPLSASGLRLTLGGNYLDYRVDQPRFRSLSLAGSATAASAQLGYPVVRSRAGNLYATAGYEHLALKDRARGIGISNRRIDAVTLGLTGDGFDSFGRGGLSEAAVTLTVGGADLSRNRDQLLVDRLTARVDGTYLKATGRLSRTQTLDAADRWTLFAGLSGQMANRNLDSSQKFLSGGPSGVRAYSVGEGIGDEGVLGTLELRRLIPAPPLKATLQLLAFVDGARLWLNDQPWQGAARDNDRGLYAAGIGLNAAGEHWSIHTAVARRIGGDVRQDTLLVGPTDTSDWRGWFQAAVRF